MSLHRLTGLIGQNPLAYFAALGLLRVVDDDARRRRAARPRLRFAASAEPVAMLSSDLDLDRIFELVVEDARQQADNRALQLAYTKDGERVVPQHPDAVRDLKPPPAVARMLLDECAARSRRESGLVAGWFSELVQAEKGDTKPTALHFTAGKQLFLKMVEELRSGIVKDHVREALLGPWLNTSQLPSLSWDSSVSRYYALRARDPSDPKEKRGSIPAANWLSVVAMEFFPVAAQHDRLATTAVSGGWKDSVFVWPIWERDLSVAVVASLLRTDLRRMRASEWSALGVARLYQASISRFDQGGYGSFSPSSLVIPKPEVSS